MIYVHKICLFLLLTALISCGDDTNKRKDNPKDVADILTLFNKEAAKHGVNVSVEGYDVRKTTINKGKIVGTCWFTKSLNGETKGLYIELDTSYWDASTAEMKELLLFHELGHCVLGQEHRTQSIMQESLFWGYYRRRDYFLEELFKHSSNIKQSVKGFIH